MLASCVYKSLDKLFCFDIGAPKAEFRTHFALFDPLSL